MTDLAVTFAADIAKRHEQKVVLDTEIRSAITTLSDLTSKVKDRSNTIAVQNNEIERLNNEAATLTELVTSKKVALDTVVQEYSSAIGRLKELRTDISEALKKKETLDIVNSQLPDLESEYLTHTANIAIAQAQHTAATVDLNETRAKIVSARETLDLLNTDVERLRAESNVLVKNAQDKAALIEQNIKANVAAAEEKIKKFEMDGPVPRKLVRHLEKKLQEKRVTFNVLEALSDYPQG